MGQIKYRSSCADGGGLRVAGRALAVGTEEGRPQDRSRFPEGNDGKKGEGKEEADPCGMTTKKAEAKATAKTNAGISPLRIITTRA